MKVGLEKQLKGLIVIGSFKINLLSTLTKRRSYFSETGKKTVKIFLLLFSKIQILSARKKSNIWVSI